MESKCLKNGRKGKWRENSSTGLRGHLEAKNISDLTPPNTTESKNETGRLETQNSQLKTERHLSVKESPILHTDSVTPFPNLDQVNSPSTNLLDSVTRQLFEQMRDLAEATKMEENLFKSASNVQAICNCAKNINSLVRTKLDIFKAYKE